MKDGNTTLQFIHAQTVVLDAAKLFDKTCTTDFEGTTLLPIFALTMTFLAAQNHLARLTRWPTKKTCATSAACHSGFRTLTPPDPEAHASCLTKSMIAPGSPYIRRRNCDPNNSATRLGFTPQLHRLAYSRCKALAQTMSGLQRAQPPWCCA